MIMAGGISSQLLGISAPGQSRRSNDVSEKAGSSTKTHMSHLTRNVLGLGCSGYSGLAYRQHFPFTPSEQMPIAVPASGQSSYGYNT